LLTRGNRGRSSNAPATARNKQNGKLCR
jgi:hypothetical protein